MGEKEHQAEGQEDSTPDLRKGRESAIGLIQRKSQRNFADGKIRVCPSSWQLCETKEHQAEWLGVLLFALNELKGV